MPFNPDLLKAIEENDSQITQIHITGTYPPLTSEDIFKLVKAAKYNTHLKEVLLDENNIGDEGAKILCELTNIEVLALGSNNITDIGAEALSKIPSLKELSLPSNLIGDKGLVSLLMHPTLETLIILDNPVSDISAKFALTNFNLKLLMLDEEAIDKNLLEKINNHIKFNEVRNDLVTGNDDKVLPDMFRI